MQPDAVIRLFAIAFLIGIAGCVGHDDPVGVVEQPEEVDDADLREPSQAVVPPRPEFSVSGT